MAKNTSEKKTLTMADLLAKHAVKGFLKGQKVTAKVSSKTPKSLILDIGGKSEGLVAESAFIEARDLIKTLEVGDEVVATVIIPETKDGNTLLSLRGAVNDSIWEKLEEKYNKAEPIDVKGVSASKAGIMVEVEGIYGFVPGSQVGRKYSGNLEELVGRKFDAVIIELDRRRNKVVLSEKEVSEKEEIAISKEALKGISEGEVYDGEITTITNFGCFVRLNIKGKKDADVEGLVHISELSWDKVKKVEDLYKKKDIVRVKVLGLKDGKLALSIKQALKDPWDEVAEKYKAEDKIKGKITKVSDFGVFVSIEPGIEGLVHITRIPPATKLRVGDEVDTFIEDINAKERRISLGLSLSSKPVGYK